MYGLSFLQSSKIRFLYLPLVVTLCSILSCLPLSHCREILCLLCISYPFHYVSLSAAFEDNTSLSKCPTFNYRYFISGFNFFFFCLIRHLSIFRTTWFKFSSQKLQQGTERIPSPRHEALFFSIYLRFFIMILNTWPVLFHLRLHRQCKIEDAHTSFPSKILHMSFWSSLDISKEKGLANKLQCIIKRLLLSVYFKISLLKI